MTPSSNPLLRQSLGLAGWVVITFVAAGIGAVASADASMFYQDLARPDWAPPGSLFGPVWTALYILMAVAAWLVWRERGFAGARTALILFMAQLAANALWTWLFFAWRLGGAAFAEIIVLWLLIAATIAAFRRTNRTAALLLLPYLGWVSYAAALNYAVWRMNPGTFG